VARDNWIDLLDPTEEMLRERAPADLHPRALVELTSRPTETPPRPVIEGHGDYVFGHLVAPVAVPDEDRFYFQELGFILTHDRITTVRKTPPDGQPFDPGPIEAICDMKGHIASGMIAYLVVDEVAERFLVLLDAVDEEVQEIEEGVSSWDPRHTQKRIAELRRTGIGIRRTLGPTRDAVRGIVDGRTDLEGRPVFRREVFPRDVELHFAQVFDKLLRAIDGLDFARDAVAAVRDFYQGQIAHDQNDVVKKLAVVASLLLVPTFIVGVYGQNFDHMPELHWHYGYLYSWLVILGLTIAQLAVFRWRRWI
jgi:magnesium transporter